MGRLLRIAFRNILEHRRRSLTLGVAIVLVTALLVLLVGISRGMQGTMLRSATTLVSGHVNVSGFYKVTVNGATPVVTDYAGVKKLIDDTVPEIDYVLDRTLGYGKMISETSSRWSMIAGVTVADELGIADVVTVEEGKLERLTEPDSALIFRSHAETLGVKVGDVLTISAPTFKGVNNTVDVRVVAIAADVGFLSQLIIFVRADVVRQLYQLAPTTTGRIMLYLKDRRDTEQVAERVRRALEGAGHTLMPREAQPFFRKFDVARRESWTGQKLDVSTWLDEIEMLSTTITAFDYLAALLVGILLVIVIIGIMNSLLMSIRERTSEIGTLRAVGMSRTRVLLMFLMEALLLTSIATIAGAALGLGLAELINYAEVDVGNDALKVFLMRDTLWLDVDLVVVVRSIAIITLTTTVFAVLPAYRAARMRPITAIHHAG